ncbi:MAG: copper homeostasis protein CutC, partial [Chitinophagaceae bacterium]
MSNLLEIAAFTIESAMAAEKAGADRIELCDNPQDGGTTPSYGMLVMAKECVSIPVFPIIRPRGGDFLYTEISFEMMRKDVKLCRELGFEGVVIGMLTKDGNIDEMNVSKLIALAYPMEVTFHRAFDRVRDPFDSLEKLISIGVPFDPFDVLLP